MKNSVVRDHQEVWSELENISGYFPREALQQVLQRRQAFYPLLAEELSVLANHPDQILTKNSSYFRHIFSLLVMAQWREKQAWPLIIKLLKNGQQHLDLLLGDVLPEAFPQIIASLCHGDLAPLKQLIEDQEADDFLRVVMLQALFILYKEQDLSREQLVDYLQQLCTEKLERSAGEVWDYLVLLCAENHLHELKPQIIKCFDDQLVETYFISQTEALELFNKQVEPWVFFAYITDLVEMIKGWECFLPDALNEDEAAELATFESDLQTLKGYNEKP